MSMVTEEQVREALNDVMDPEIRRPITELNMVDAVKIDGGNVEVTILLTTAGCPLKTPLRKMLRPPSANLTVLNQFLSSWAL